MDTGTHLVIGLGLAGLSQIDPSVSADSAATTAVFIGTVIGSQIPDVDGLLRFKGNATYIRNHRGRSHSLPAFTFMDTADHWSSCSVLPWNPPAAPGYVGRNRRLFSRLYRLLQHLWYTSIPAIL